MVTSAGSAPGESSPDLTCQNPACGRDWPVRVAYCPYCGTATERAKPVEPTPVPPPPDPVPAPVASVPVSPPPAPAVEVKVSSSPERPVAPSVAPKPVVAPAPTASKPKAKPAPPRRPRRRGFWRWIVLLGLALVVLRYCWPQGAPETLTPLAVGAGWTEVPVATWAERGDRLSLSADRPFRLRYGETLIYAAPGQAVAVERLPREGVEVRFADGRPGEVRGVRR